MGRPAASVGAAAGRVSVWRRDSGARHGFTVAKRIPATCMVVVRGLRPLSVRCERRATAHYFVEHHRRCLVGLPQTLTKQCMCKCKEVRGAQQNANAGSGLRAVTEKFDNLFTVRHRGMETGISEASKRVSIFSFATQGGKQVSFYF